ncbi:MAG: tetratricopeptide repeat protein [Acidobacteria bacterium]|nr:tetratricopeptide repeat protein [Acidobacteriota bacterium]
MGAFLVVAVFLVAAAARAEVEVKTLAGELDGAVGGVAVDSLGYVYVADFGEKVWKISPFGEVEVFVDQLYGASGNTLDPEGNLLQSSFHGGYVSKIARDGSVSTLARGIAGPVGVALDAAGNTVVCACRSNSLVRITPAGEVEDFASSPLLNCPNGITRGPQGELYVVNFSDGRMLKVSQEGDVSEFAVIPGGGNGHVVFAGGVFYVTGFRSNRIYQVTSAGEVRAFAGTGAFSDTDGPASEATFASPNGIAFDGTRRILYVNDYLVPFLQRFQQPPRSSVRRMALPNLTRAFDEAFAEGGFEAAVAAYRAFRVANPGAFTEIETNALGYRYLQQGKVAEALRIFELNTEDYPKSFNAWDSLGEAMKAAGRTEDAVRHYRKSLELNPGNTNAVKMLEELGAEP